MPRRWRLLRIGSVRETERPKTSSKGNELEQNATSSQPITSCWDMRRTTVAGTTVTAEQIASAACRLIGMQWASYLNPLGLTLGR